MNYPADPTDIEALLAFHRSVFGDARMDADDTSGDDDTTDDNADDTEGQESEEEKDGDKDDKSKDGKTKLTPEQTEAELKRVRGEAARYRTQLREAKDALAKAKTPEEQEAAVKDLQDKIADLEMSVLRGNVARKYNLPDELAARLQGDDEKALEEDAKSLQKFATTKKEKVVTPKGGLDPDDKDDLPDDPRELARKFGKRARR